MFRRKRIYRKKWRIEEKINLFLGMILIVVVLPLFITTFWRRLDVEELLFHRPTRGMDSIERQLPEIVAKQISIHMPEEVVKAQSVIARTQLMLAEENGGTAPGRFTLTELQELWGEQFNSYYQNLQELIAETAGVTLQYDNSYIYAAYHQVSAGNTRNISEYYGKNTMPYLSSADCHGDTTAEGYFNVYYWRKDDFLELCKNIFPNETIVAGEDIQIIKRDAAGYALQVQVGQTIYEGEEFRGKLNLPSACFLIKVLDGDIRITTMGCGHGFGMSQYMAKVLAEEGKDYKEILQYFYQGVVITE